MTTITVTGHRAALIEIANRASFYGINKSFGNTSEIVTGLKAARDSVKEWLTANGIDYNGFLVIAARTVDSTDAKVHYMAEIDFSYD